MNNIDHVGIAVDDIQKAELRYASLLGMRPTYREYLEEDQLHVVFFEKGESSIELLQSNNKNHPIYNFVKNKGEGLHHIAYNVKAIDHEIERLKKNDFAIIGEVKKGARNHLTVFVHPKSTQGVLIELCQKI